MEVDIDRGALLAFLASGVIWLGGFSVGLRTGPILGGIAAVYVAVGSVALASSRLRTDRTLVVLWAVAVTLFTALLVPDAGWLSPVIGVFIGSILFAAWSATGLLVHHAFTGGP